MASSPRSEEEDTDEEPTVPAGVIEGIEDLEEGRTADDDDLDDAVDL
jgi:hypothetical protein